MSVPFYVKSPENQGYIKNMEVVGFCDLNGVNAFQMALHKTDDGRYYMYCGSFRGPGWNVVDVTDPTQPKVVNWLEACDPKEYPATNTPKIQVADGLMIGATGGGVSFLHGCKPGDKSLGSLQIFDIKTDPVHPSCWASGRPAWRTAWACTASSTTAGATSTCLPTARATPATSTASWTSSTPPTPGGGPLLVPCSSPTAAEDGEWPRTAPSTGVMIRPSSTGLRSWWATWPICPAYW